VESFISRDFLKLITFIVNLCYSNMCLCVTIRMWTARSVLGLEYWTQCTESVFFIIRSTEVTSASLSSWNETLPCSGVTSRIAARLASDVFRGSGLPEIYLCLKNRQNYINFTTTTTKNEFWRFQTPLNTSPMRCAAAWKVTIQHGSVSFQEESEAEVTSVE